MTRNSGLVVPSLLSNTLDCVCWSNARLYPASPLESSLVIQDTPRLFLSSAHHFPLLIKLFSNAKECCVFHKRRWTRTEPLLSSRGEKNTREPVNTGLNIVTGSEYYIIKRMLSVEHQSCCARVKQNQTEWRTEFPCKEPPLTSKTERLRLVQAQRLDISGI